MKSVTIRQALQQVADYPQPIDDEDIVRPVYELVARTLFDIANRPDASVRGSLGRANRARKIILERMGGRRRAGTPPPNGDNVAIDFVDLTGGTLDERATSDEPLELEGPAQ